MFFVVANFIAAFIHELGHAGTAALQGGRGIEIHFGGPPDRRLTVRLGYLSIFLHPGVTLFTRLPYCFVSDWPLQEGRRGYLQQLAFAVAGPLASLLLILLVMWSGYWVNPFRPVAPIAFSTILGWVSFGHFVIPMIPMRYNHPVVRTSDGLKCVLLVQRLLGPGQADRH